MLWVLPHRSLGRIVSNLLGCLTTISSKAEGNQVTRGFRIAVSVVGALAIAWPAHGATNEGGAAVSVVEGMSDADFYAAEFGVSVEEAQRRFSIMDAAEHELELLAGMAKARLAGTWFEHSPSFRIVVSLTGKDPDAAIDEAVAKSHLPIHVLYGAERTLDDLRSELDAIEPSLESTIPGAYSYVDVRTNSVVIGAAPEQEASLDILSLGDAALTVETGPALVPQVLYGGRRLTFSPGRCTTGFTTRNPSNVAGVTTSAHCPNTNIQYQQQGNLVFPMTLSGEYWDQDEDWQFVTPSSSQSAEPRFWDGAQWVTVTNPQPPSDSAMIGQFVCHSGTTTGKSCGTIKTVWFDPGDDLCGPNNGNCYPTWVRVEGANLECAGGDSGGPWFRNSRAYGSHTFGPESGACYAAIFMSAYYIHARGFTILSD